MAACGPRCRLPAAPLLCTACQPVAQAASHPPPPPQVHLDSTPLGEPGLGRPAARRKPGLAAWAGSAGWPPLPCRRHMPRQAGRAQLPGSMVEGSSTSCRRWPQVFTDPADPGVLLVAGDDCPTYYAPPHVRPGPAPFPPVPLWHAELHPGVRARHLAGTPLMVAIHEASRQAWAPALHALAPPGFRAAARALLLCHHRLAAAPLVQARRQGQWHGRLRSSAARQRRCTLGDLHQARPAVPCRAVLCRAVPCRAVLCCAVLCCAADAVDGNAALFRDTCRLADWLPPPPTSMPPSPPSRVPPPTRPTAGPADAHPCCSGAQPARAAPAGPARGPAALRPAARGAAAAVQRWRGRGRVTGA